MELIKRYRYEIPSLGERALLLLDFKPNNMLNGVIDKDKYFWCTGMWTEEGWELDSNLKKYDFDIVEWYELKDRHKSNNKQKELEDFWRGR